MTDHQLEIPVFIQQRVAVTQAIRSDDEIDGLPHREAKCAQPPEIARRGDGDAVVQQPHDLESAQITFDTASMAVVARSLKKLQKHKVADQDVISPV
ncbi:MAG: hypothetical protein ABI369_09220 [Acetobacteraceae bacterium]